MKQNSLKNQPMTPASSDFPEGPDFFTASAADYTGLIPFGMPDDATLEYYSDLYPFSPVPETPSNPPRKEELR